LTELWWESLRVSDSIVNGRNMSDDEWATIRVYARANTRTVAERAEALEADIAWGAWVNGIVPWQEHGV